MGMTTGNKSPDKFGTPRPAQVPRGMAQQPVMGSKAGKGASAVGRDQGTLGSRSQSVERTPAGVGGGYCGNKGKGSGTSAKRFFK